MLDGRCNIECCGRASQCGIGWGHFRAVRDSFCGSASSEDRQRFRFRTWWQRPMPIVIALMAFALLNSLAPVGIRPILVKDLLERTGLQHLRKVEFLFAHLRISPGNRHSPIVGSLTQTKGGHTRAPNRLRYRWLGRNNMYHYDGTQDSISFLQYDLVKMAYRLPGIRKSAVIGVGGGRDIVSAYFFGVRDITGVELNPIL